MPEQGADTESLTVRDALARHYVAHGLPADGGQSANWFRVRLGPVVIPVPNPPARQRAVFFHDVNHIATGYNTVFSDGEMVIAGYEIRTGCGPYTIAWYINLTVMALGLVVCPRKVFHAFVRGRGGSNAYHLERSREEVERMTVGELRSRFALDRPPRTVTSDDRLRFVAWSAVAVGVTLLSAALGIVVLAGIGAGLARVL
jgi:hypothetical protein